MTRREQSSLTLLSPATSGDPFIDQLFEDGEGHHAVVDDDRMEVLDVEAPTERLFRACAELAHLVVAQQVAESLRRGREISIHLALGEPVVDATLLGHIGDGLVARPVVGVAPGVHHETRGAEEPRLQVAEMLVRILVKTHVVAERFGIQCPALGVGNVEARLRAPWMQAFDLVRARDLHVMPRYGLVQEERLRPPFRLVRVAERDRKSTRLNSSHRTISYAV